MSQSFDMIVNAIQHMAAAVGISVPISIKLKFEPILCALFSLGIISLLFLIFPL